MPNKWVPSKNKFIESKYLNWINNFSKSFSILFYAEQYKLTM